MPSAAATISPPYEREAQAFLDISSQFRLGALTTEGINPRTSNLSMLAGTDLCEALSVLRAVDLEAIQTVRARIPEIVAMSRAIRTATEAGDKVYITGCGSTGRLALSAEFLARDLGMTNFRGIMTGGDAALIRSIEFAEDNLPLAIRQLEDAEFGRNDLLIAVTEGGETPWVISTVNHAAATSSRSPHFLYCNPDDALRDVQRSKEVLDNDSIAKMNLTCGPMAISGSTRMQATTVQILAVMLAIEAANCEGEITDSGIAQRYGELLEMVEGLDYTAMCGFVEGEAALYQRDQPIIYLTDANLGVCVLTDTTERGPTFSMVPFENLGAANDKMSLSYLVVRGAEDTQSAWKTLLGNRDPRPIADMPVANMQRLLGFDISEKTLERRRGQPIFNICEATNGFTMSLSDQVATFNAGESLFAKHLALKLLLNAHSTLVMGRLGRYEGNVMTWVVATNNKLIDRAVRYIDTILRRREDVEGVDFNRRYPADRDYEARYKAITYELFKQRQTLPLGGSIVLTTVDALAKT